VLHLFLDNTRHHHAKLLQDWLARPGYRIKLHVIPTHCRHLDPIEWQWGLMHKHITHNQCHATCRDFSGDPDVSARGGPQELAHLLRQDDGQLPNHLPQVFSDSGLSGVYPQHDGSEAEK